MGALLDLWICCFAGFRRSVVMGLRNWGFASMCLCGFTELCVSGLAGPRWRAPHRAAGASRPCGLSSLTPSPLRCCALCLPPGERPAVHPRRAGLGAPFDTAEPARRIGREGCDLDERLVWSGGAGLLFPSPYHAVLAVKVCAYGARWRPGGRLRTLTAALRRAASGLGQSRPDSFQGEDHDEAHHG